MHCNSFDSLIAFFYFKSGYNQDTIKIKQGWINDK